jgi:hypothetical protein
MDPIIQWGITSAIAVIALLAGRYWAFHDRLLIHDKQVITELMKKLPSDNIILFLRQHDFGASFDVDKLQELDSFYEFSLSPEYHFVNRKLEKLRVQLVKASSLFNSYLSRHTWQISHDGSRVNKMKSPEEFSNEEAYWTEKDKINNMANQVCKSYDLLIKTASEKEYCF